MFIGWIDAVSLFIYELKILLGKYVLWYSIDAMAYEQRGALLLCDNMTRRKTPTYPLECQRMYILLQQG
jgi:hypothetical protein